MIAFSNRYGVDRCTAMDTAATGWVTASSLTESAKPVKEVFLSNVQLRQWETLDSRQQNWTLLSSLASWTHIWKWDSPTPPRNRHFCICGWQRITGTRCVDYLLFRARLEGCGEPKRVFFRRLCQTLNDTKSRNQQSGVKNVVLIVPKHQVLGTCIHIARSS